MADITVDLLETQTFYQLPKIFFTRLEKIKGKKGQVIGKVKYTSSYAKLSNDTKICYGVLYDRCLLSMKKYREGSLDYVDENGSVYLVYTVQDLMELLNLSKGTVAKVKKELAEHGLLREVRQGMNKPNRLYLQLVDATKQSVEHYDLDDQLLETKPFLDRVVFHNLEERQKEAQSLDMTGSLNFGRPKNEPLDVQILDGSNTNKSETKLDIISSRKTGGQSDDLPQPAGADNQSLEKNSVGYVQPKYYSLLQVIADKYNDLFLYSHGFTMTHHQKMAIGRYLEEGYILSHEVLDMLDRVPHDCQQPLAYLMQCLSNLKDERLLEAKLNARRQAEARYGS